MNRLIFILTLTLSQICFAQTKFEDYPLYNFLNQSLDSEVNWVRKDISEILRRANFESDYLSFEKHPAENSNNIARVKCGSGKVHVDIFSSESEWSSTLYKSLQKMGFLFPHPARQITPEKTDIQKLCGQTITWSPRYPVRGFHLHNMHPNEWVDALYLDGKDKMHNLLKWIKRNQQNFVQIQMIKVDEKKFSNHLKEILHEAAEAKIITGLSVSFSLYQQKGYSLLPWYSALTGWRDESILRDNIKALQNLYEFQVMTFELGTTEFTHAPYEKTLKWIEIARDELSKKNQMIFNKIHASSNQKKEPYGNFNYLPQYSHKDVGVLPHTVMAYSLEDDHAPVYGLDNFHSMKDYLIEQSQKRPTIYYPETSYYCSMDIDLPLFLTDYLITRSSDMNLIDKYPVWGQVNFTTGQDMGYWMMDWTVALLADAEFTDQPLIGMKLLGEDLDLWQQIANYQTKHFKDEQLIQYLSFSNLQDELNVLGKAFFVHMRKLLRDYFLDPGSHELKAEIYKLQKAKDEMPDITRIKSEELKILMQVTFNRLNHALALRQHISDMEYDAAPTAHQLSRDLSATIHSEGFLKDAREARLESLSLLKTYKTKFMDYPDTLVDSCHDNPTSYTCGYAWTALSLYHWEREEDMVARKIYNPFYRNYYQVMRILF